MLRFVPRADDSEVVYSGGVKLGYLNSGGRIGFFTMATSFSSEELKQISKRLDELEKEVK